MIIEKRYGSSANQTEDNLAQKPGILELVNYLSYMFYTNTWYGILSLEKLGGAH